MKDEQKIVGRDYESEYNCLLEKNKHLESVLDEMRKRRKTFENQLETTINEANERYAQDTTKYIELQKKYDELKEMYNSLQLSSDVKRARLETFEYCIEHIFGE